ncbi:hypothetical protein AB0J82_06195 [Asanoa sp. NPDC049518]|uniref:DUF6197 family protein n=1 Tax=unclassified Asanoa TaxID=2685164 RepID=UPI0034126BF4
MQPIRNLTISAADIDSLPAVTPADILRGAARYLEVRGWCQNCFFAATPLEAFPAVCIDGAIRMAALGSDTTPGTHDPAVRDITRAQWALIDYLTNVGLIDPTDADPEPHFDDDLGPELKKLPLTPRGWNDLPGRTATDVIHELRAAADAWDRQHAITASGDQS